MEGLSLVPSFTGELARTEQPIFWEYQGNRAVRIGKWKLVAERAKGWELYDVEADRTELNNLIEQQPERAAEMGRRYDQWAERAGAESNLTAQAMEPSTQPR